MNPFNIRGGGCMSFLRDRRGVSTGAGIVLAALIIALVLFFASGGTALFQAAPTAPVVQQTTTPAVGYLVGPVNVYQKCYDSFDITTTYTHGTEYNVLWFLNRIGNWVNPGSGDTTLELSSEDNGYIYPVVSIPSGQSYYVDYAKIQANNSRVKQIMYEDVTGDKDPDFIFKAYVGDLPEPATGNPQWTFLVYLKAYEKPTLKTSHTDSDSDGTPDISGIGTSTASKYIEIWGEFSNTKRSWAIYKLEFKIATTDETKVVLDWVNVPGLGTVSGTQFTMEKTGSEIIYTYTIGKDLSNALYFNYGTEQLNKFDLTTKVTCHLATGDQINTTLTLYGIQPDLDYESISKTIELIA
jgi:hypothetical protein